MGDPSDWFRGSFPAPQAREPVRSIVCSRISLNLSFAPGSEKGRLRPASADANVNNRTYSDLEGRRTSMLRNSDIQAVADAAREVPPAQGNYVEE